MTLLKNDDFPPLEDVDRLLVTGPSADSVRNQIGGWSLGWQGLPNDIDAEPAAVTVVEGLRGAAPSDTEVVHVPTGYTFNPYGDHEYSFENVEEVRSAAESADATVAVVGEGPHSEGFGDVNDLRLADAQQRLLDVLADTGTPTAGVIVAGRPVGGPETMATLDAALMAYQPGTAGGTAVARVLFGETDPGGRLPFTWPTSTGQLLSVYNHLPPASGTSDGNEPLFEFGHGPSYADFEYELLDVSPGRFGDGSDLGTLEVSVRVANRGDRSGTDVVSAVAVQSYGSVVHPDERLMGFERVSLDPGESERVTVEAPVETLPVVPGDVPGDADEPTVEDGQYAVRVGEMAETFTVGSGGYTDWGYSEGAESEPQDG